MGTGRKGLTGLVVGVAILAAPTAAHASDDEVRVSGECTAASTSKIKAKVRDGAIEVEFEVDQNVNGDRWKVRIKDDGDVAYRGTHRTKAPSGSFSVERRIADGPGGDRLTGVARNIGTGERCKAELQI